MGDGGELSDDSVRKLIWISLSTALDVMRIPGHDNVRQQGQRSGYGLHLFSEAAVLGADGAGMNGSLQAVHRLALVQQIEDTVAEFAVPKIITQINGPQQLADGGACCADRIALRHGPVLRQCVGRRIPAPP